MPRVLLGIVALSVLVVLVGVVSAVTLRWALASKDAVIAHQAADLLAIEEVSIFNERAARKARTFLLTENPRFLREYRETRTALQDSLARLQQRLTDAAEREHLARVIKVERDIGERSTSLMERRQKGLSAEQSGALLEAEIQPDRDELDANLAALEREKTRELAKAKAASDRNASRAFAFLLLTMGASLLLSGGLALLLVRAYRDVTRAADYQQRVIAIVGHDLRSPLAAILASASHALSKAALDDKVAAIITRVLRAARRIEVLAALLVDFTRARSGVGLAVVPQHDDLEEVCAQVVQEFRLTHPDRSLLLEKKGQARGDFDRDKVMQVLANLIDNAIRHGSPDAPVVVLCDGTNPSLLAVSVRNEGASIDPKLLPHIFEPFRYGKRPEAAAIRESLGMGLYIVSEVVKAHGGKVEVDSTTSGTTFKVLLPRIPITA